MKKLLIICCFIALSNVVFSQDWSTSFYWSRHQNKDNVYLGYSNTQNNDYTFDFKNNNGKALWSVCQFSPQTKYILNVRNNGRVGIMTKDPEKHFHVDTETLFSGDVKIDFGNDIILDCDENTSNNFYFEFGRNNKDAISIQDPDNKSLMYIASENKVGINTADPQATLHVKGTSRFQGGLLITGTVSIDSLRFGNNSILTNNGKLGIGTIDPKQTLHVVGNAKVRGDIIAGDIVMRVSSFPDYVFEDNYKLMPLEKVENYIEENGHLPKIPSASEIVEQGIDIAQMNVLLMEKIEELTLHAIDHEKELQSVQKDYYQALKEWKELRKKMEE
ncbi:MAG: hypothetical protein ACEPOV_10255 [Hyphomicrobiales bacterium]